MIENISNTGNKIVITLSGKIYVDEATEIRENIIPFIERGRNEFLFNMTNVEYIDSSGLGVLVAIQKKSQQKGGGVTIEGLRGDVREIFDLTRLTKVFEIR